MITAYERLNSVVQGGIIHILRDEVPKKENPPRTNRYTQTRQKSTSGFSYTGNARNSKHTQMTRKSPSERKYKEQFGDYALRNGFITHFEHLAIVGRQKKLQPPIGEYFIQKGILAGTELKNMIESLKIHNSKIIKRAKGVFNSSF